MKETNAAHTNLKLRILVVDDNARFREPFTRVLYHYLYIEAVLQAASLAEAREKLEGIDLALIDRGLPDGDGLELITELREASPATKVLVMSVTVEQLHPREAVEAGADGVIDKIAPPEHIAAQIRALRPDKSATRRRVEPTSIHRSA